MTPGWATVAFIVCMVIAIWGAGYLIFADYGHYDDPDITDG